MSTCEKHGQVDYGGYACPICTEERIEQLEETTKQLEERIKELEN